MVLSSVIGAFALFAASVTAAPSSLSQLQGRQACEFHPRNSPECWDGVYNLSTDYYTRGPKQDPKTPRKYHFKLENVTTLAPDGTPRTVLAINGKIPGPTIWARWGDTVEVTVENALDYAGTTIHFHGIRQNRTLGQDGVPSITQCPIPGDGGKMTYTWVATQYGTSWYHSHYGVQAWDGVFGAIHIEGPASSKYDTDLGPVMLSDWTHATSDSLLEAAALNFGGVPMNNGLINGTNTYKKPGEETVVGKRFELFFEEGKSHRIRFINTAMDTMYKISFDDHEMEVISADFVSIQPFTTKVLPIAIGQRYDVIVKATAGGGNHWLRAVAMGSCGSGRDEGFDVRAIVRYDPNNKDTPAEKEPTTIIDDDCLDVPTSMLKPSLEINLKDVPAKFEPDHDIPFAMNYNETSGLVDWRVRGQPYYSPWDYPTVQQILEGNTTYDPRQQLIHVDGKKEWIYALIRTDGTTHPIHLHGHDFFILGQSDQEFNPDTFVPQTTNPPRRDVAMITGSGYVVVAFQTDNPGAWLLHCHIGWHASQGFALTFMENIDRVKDFMNKDQLLKQCEDWKTFAAAKGIKQHDSGV
ncbi:multicopper oxidase [Podospora aff. communis PSN243]|uniref:Multicopper oxidase n=1 Tax=Podospora aff. communis PSN243 TaxID=3040156 RepID=A0AAV9GPU6_9PEZI|nr:multicopper oxidase [Podospora aff. communis PSN243]